jgi:hypothetical protein
VTVHAETAAATATSGANVSIAAGTRMLIHWSDIAIEQERLACAERSALESEVEEAKANGRGLELTRELHPSLIAIAAASHALDALYGELRDLALPHELRDKWKDRRRRPPPPRTRQIHEALKHGFRIPAQRWSDELETLFDLRDGALHPKTTFRESERHPLGVNTAKEYVVYRCEKATEAVDLLFEILETCAGRPKPALEQWGTTCGPRSGASSRPSNMGA